MGTRHVLRDAFDGLASGAVDGAERLGYVCRIMRVIRIHATGGADRLQFEEVPVPEPGPGEVRVRVAAAGINFVDTYKRSGLYPVSLPHILGQEAAGVVSALGPDVTGFAVGDEVAGVNMGGAYAEETLAPAARLVRVPVGVTLETAAALLLQGLTAHYLATDTFPLRPGDTALVHAAAGGVGLLLVQLAKQRGVRVLATVGTEEKAALAREAGADEVCLYTREDFSVAARRFTEGRGVDVVYDAVGQSTFEGSLNSLRPRGMLVSYGNASGPVPPFSPLVLSQKGSLFLTRPSLGDYTQTPEELQMRAAELLEAVRSGALHVRIGARFPLAEAAAAHRALEGRKTTGKVLLVV